ncbi:MAG TPA: zf-HC2 domain-containing protein [Gemmatimonadales bacterium]|nr:zf-HC2 domain-containing protein [Gemmatimonadales bacterium]
MTDTYTDLLSDYLDDELPADLRTEVSEHLEQCAECRATLAELRTVLARARTLSADQSGTDQWQGIAALIQKPGIGGKAVRRRVLMTWPELAAAAVLLVVAGAGGAWLMLRGHRPQPVATITIGPAASTIGADPRAPHAVAAGLVAGKEYDDAIHELRAVLNENRGKLDTVTVRVLEQSLARIDRAITDAEHALAADPGNAYLSGHLAQTRLRKLDLLRHAAALTAARS